VVEGYRTCQARLGAKLHDPKDPAQDLGPMFRQVVGTLFALAGRYRAQWAEVTSARTPPTLGFRADYSAEPIAVSVPRLTWKFVDGFIHHHDLWGRVLSEGSMDGVERAVGQAAEDRGRFVLDPELWTKIVYDFMVAYNTSDVDPAVLLDSLIPLYFARTATFVEEVRDLSDEEAEARIERAVDVAVEMKDYLRERWKAPVLAS
jgi:hypothetical protein